MLRSPRPRRPLVALAAVLLVAGCVRQAPPESAAPPPAATPQPPAAPLPPPLDLADRVQAYLAACARGDVDEAESFLASGARFWREQKTGPGEPIDRRAPAAAWEDELHTSLTCADLVTVGAAVGGVCEERNDLYRLLGIDTWRIRLTTWFDDQDKIREQFIEPLPDNPDFDALLEPVLDWAAAEKPAELAALFPDERLERNRDTARRWRALLEEWRKTR